MSQQIYSLPPLATWVSYLAIPSVPHPPEHVSNAAHYAMAEIRGKIIREEIIREEPIRLAEAKTRLGRLAELSRKGKTVRFIARGELFDLDWARTEQEPAVRTARRDRRPTQGSSRPGAAGSAAMVVGWEAIVKAVEQEKGERWMEFRDRYGDWGRDVALWLGRTAGRMRLQELAGKVGGVDYTAASAAVGRVRRGLPRPRAENQSEMINWLDPSSVQLTSADTSTDCATREMRTSGVFLCQL